MNEIAVYRLIIGAFVIVSAVILLIDWCVFRELNKFKKLLAERNRESIDLSSENLDLVIEIKDLKRANASFEIQNKFLKSVIDQIKKSKG